MCSRHKRKKEWLVFVLMDAAANGVEKAVAWCCQCSSGLRTVCPCAHAFSVIAILSTGLAGPVPSQRLSDLISGIENTDSGSE